MDKIVDRLKSPVFWATLIVFLLNQLWIPELLGVDGENLEIIINSIVGLIITGGLLNNPQNNYFTRKKNDNMLN